MAKCSVCGKGVTFGHNVSHSNRKTNRAWKANIRHVKAIVDGTPKTVNVCSRCLRSGKITRAIWFKIPCEKRLSRTRQPCCRLGAGAKELRIQN